jgi:CRISPR-associated protein Cmr3
MRLWLEPADVLFFRTSRSFTAGEGGFALSLFPPTPETIQGSIRARIAAYFAAEWGVSLAGAFEKTLKDGSRPLQQLIGDQKSYGSFRLHGYTLGRRTKTGVELLFPPPAHLLRGEDSHRIFRLAPAEPDGTLHTNLPDGLGLLEPRGGYPTDEKLEEFEEWLTLEELRLAFSASEDGLKDIKGVPPGDLFEFEPRLGIGMINARKTTQEGLLYQANFVRLKRDAGLDVGLVVDVGLKDVEPDQVQERLKLPDKGWLALGGERRASSFEVLGAAPLQSALELAQGERSCLYFVTPTYFERGWQPADWQALVGTAPVAAAVSRAQLIGGWKQESTHAGGSPKALRRCVPAGSVYFFDRAITVHGPITNDGGAIGYGLAYQGAW